MLMHRENRIAFQNPSTNRIIMPPPLPFRTLRVANTESTLECAVSRFLVAIRPEKLGHAVDRIDLIGKASCASAQPTSDASAYGQMAEEAPFALIFFHQRVRPVSQLLQLCLFLRKSQGPVCKSG